MKFFGSRGWEGWIWWGSVNGRGWSGMVGRGWGLGGGGRRVEGEAAAGDRDLGGWATEGGDEIGEPWAEGDDVVGALEQASGE
jgi:hypothetical protein